MNIAKMLKQAQQMQAKMQTAQEELARQTVEANIANGKVIVTANAAGEVLSLKLDPVLVAANDPEMLEDLILTGVQQALAKGKAAAAEEMQKITGGLGLPPGLGF